MFNILKYYKSPPKFEVWHSHPGQISQVLLTAGMHGDELASIEAAKSLIKTYHGKLPITIIPIVNRAAYSSGTSRNPYDNRDPLYLYPGSRYGSSSSKLMAQVAQFVRGKKIWIDLHSGAKDEHLKPFIWAADPYPFLSHLSGRILVDPTYQKDIPYVILESGELGIIDQKSVNQHLAWVQSIIKNLDEPPKSNWQPTYNQLVYEKNTGQDIKDKNFLWSSPSHYISGKIA